MSRLGVAIGSDSITARATGSGAGITWQRTLSGYGVPGDVWRTELREALRALHTAAPSADELAISLLPPVADVRIADLPALDDAALRAAVQRDAGKYFPVGGEQQIVQVHALRTAPPAPFAPHLLSAATAHVVTEILAAAAASGWRVAVIAAAQLAWASAASARSNVNGARHSAVVSHAGRSEILDIVGGQIVRVRRRRTADGASGARVIAVDDREAADVAARFADVSDSYSLWPAAVYQERERAIRRRAWICLAAAAALMLAVGAVEWIGAARELTRIAAERRAARPRVEAALAAYDTLHRLGLQTQSVGDFASTGPRWSSLLVALSTALPADAWLVSVGAHGDTLTIVGEAEHAAAAFSALAQSKALSGVRADSPIQQQVQNGEVVAERFTIAATLARRGTR